MLDDNHNPYLGYDMIGRWDRIGFFFGQFVCLIYRYACLCVLCLYMRFSNKRKQNKTSSFNKGKENKNRKQSFSSNKTKMVKNRRWWCFWINFFDFPFFSIVFVVEKNHKWLRNDDDVIIIVVEIISRISFLLLYINLNP